MRSFRTAFAVTLVSLLAWSGLAQDYPMPVPAGSPPQLCATCVAPFSNLPTPQFPPPFKSHTGRILDSNANKDWQQTPRTLRARVIWIAPERDRIYLHFGASRLASYKLSTFFATDLSKPLTVIQGAPQAGREKHLPWHGYLDAEVANSNWETSILDSQDRFNWLDWDDRGNILVGYGPYGWGIIKDGSGLMPLIEGSQVKENAGVIISLKAGGKYYAVLVETAQSSRVYDVTNVASPQFLRKVSLGGKKHAKISSSSGEHLAFLDNQGVMRIWRAADFVAGGSPTATIQPRPSSKFIDITTDGTDTFYGIEYGTTTSISIIRQAGSTFDETKRSVSTFNPNYSFHYGAGYLAAIGSDYNARLFRLVNDVPQEIDLKSFIKDYYFSPLPGHAIPFNTIPRDLVIHKSGGKEYLMVTAGGLADVYELQTRPSISVSLNTGGGNGWGTQNQYSKKKTEGPFYGDKVPLKSTFEGSANIQWNFGNPESPATNTTSTSTGVAFTYQYSGLTTAAAIGSSKLIKAHEILDPTNSDQLSLQLSVPELRVGIRDRFGTANEVLFTQPNASSSAPIVFGDEWVDASDGAVESHTSVWSINGTQTLLAPNVPQNVGPCGAHTLNFQGRYGPNGDYQSTLGPIGYNVRPFAAAISLGTSSASAINFHATNSRFSSIATSSPTISWAHLSSGGAVLAEATGGTLSTPFAVSKPVPLGSTVRLTITLPSVADPGCNAAQFLTSVATFKLNPPDPGITQSGTCQYTGPGCTLTAGSLSGADLTGWTYAWRVDGSPSVSGTQKTFNTNFSTTGSHSVQLTATNAVDSASATKTFSLTAPPCGTIPTNSIAISYYGTQTTCAPCAQREPIKFYPSPYNYTFQECDTFNWDFGDGTTSTQKEPVHDFAGNGPYIVKLTVRGTYTTTETVKFGNDNPPPQCPRPTGTPDINFQGASSGCSPINATCRANETISFSGSVFGGTIENCHSFNWTFGDGTSSSSRNPTKSYTVNGPKTVKLTISGGGGSITFSTSINITGGGDGGGGGGGSCAAAPGRDSVDFDYDGQTTHCSTASGECSRSELVRFNASLWQYTIQDCDTLTWSWDDGTPDTVATGIPGLSVTHTFAQAKGAYQVKLVVSNSKGNASVTKQVKFQGSGVAVPNNVTLQGANSGVVNVPMSFSASANAPANGPIEAWTWNFGDNTPQVTTTSPSTTHTFTRGGTFNMSVTARNVGGTSAPAGKSIVITDGVQFAFMLPVVAHVSGRNNTVWRTDLHVFDPNHTAVSQPLKLNAEFGRITKELEITSSTFVLEDFMTFFKDQDDAGPVIIRGVAGKVPQIWTRTYNRTPAGGSYGQLIPAIAMNTSGGDLVTEDSAYIAAGVRHGNGRRTNIGIVSLSPIPTEVRIIAYDDRLELPIGEFTQTLEPFHLVQIGNIDQFIPNLPLRPFSVKFVSSLAVPIMAYASEVDNATGDPRFIAAARESSYSSESYRQQILPLIGPSSEWKTDATIFNLEAAALQVTLAYFDASGNRMKESQVSVNARSFVQLEDVLTRQLSLTGTTGGMVRVEVNGTPARNPIVMGATYKLREGGGAYGQGFSALPVGAPNIKQNKPGYIAGVKNDDHYMTNIGLVNSGNDAALVTVRLLDKDSGAEIDSWLYALNGNVSVVRNIFEAMEATATSGTLKIETIGGSVWAYASMVEKGTGDPELIPAVAGQ